MVLLKILKTSYKIIKLQIFLEHFSVSDKSCNQF